MILAAALVERQMRRDQGRESEMEKIKARGEKREVGDPLILQVFSNIFSTTAPADDEDKPLASHNK